MSTDQRAAITTTGAAIVATLHTYGETPETFTLIGPDAAGEFAAYRAPGYLSGVDAFERGTKMTERAARAHFGALLSDREYRR